METTQAELQVDNNPNLPPLMNPAMLEASEDLTNLSHLNEPAGLSDSWNLIENDETDPIVKSSRLSNSAMRKRKYIHTVESSLSQPTLSPGSTRYMSHRWCRCMLGNTERRRPLICLQSPKRHLRKSAPPVSHAMHLLI